MQGRRVQLPPQGPPPPAGGAVRLEGDARDPESIKAIDGSGGAFVLFMRFTNALGPFASPLTESLSDAITESLSDTPRNPISYVLLSLW